MELPTSLQGLLSSLGVFAPLAAFAWWVIKNQRADLIRERDESNRERDAYAAALTKERIDRKEDRDLERKRNDALADRVFALAESSNRTAQELSAAINDIRRH